MSFVPLLLLLPALVLTGIAAAQFRALWRQLPGPAVANLDRDALRDARGRYAARAREGLILLINSDAFTAALHEPSRLDEIIATTRQTATMVPHSHLPRLQIAALALARLERDQVPIEQWWLRMEGYLSGLDDAPLDHLTHDLLEAETETYRRLGLRAGTARRMALGGSGYAHGPLLQFIVARLDQLALHAEDADIAARCTRLADRLLRDWLLEPGPPELKLLAADLLAARVAEEQPALAQRCRAVRAAYHAGAAPLPALPMLLRVTENATPAARDGLRVAHSLGTTIVLLGAAVCLAVVALLGSPLWIARGAPTTFAEYALAAAPGCLLVLAAVLTPVVASGPLLEDLRREGHEGLGGPRLALVASVATLAVLVAATLLARRTPHARVGHRAARLAGASWLIVSLALLPVVWQTRAAHDTYQQALARPADDLFTILGGPEAAALLAEVRAWHP